MPRGPRFPVRAGSDQSSCEFERGRCGSAVCVLSLLSTTSYNCGSSCGRLGGCPSDMTRVDEAIVSVAAIHNIQGLLARSSAGT